MRRASSSSKPGEKNQRSGTLKKKKKTGQKETPGKRHPRKIGGTRFNEEKRRTYDRQRPLRGDRTWRGKCEELTCSEKGGSMVRGGMGRGQNVKDKKRVYDEQAGESTKAKSKGGFSPRRRHAKTHWLKREKEKRRHRASQKETRLVGRGGGPLVRKDR